MIRFKDVAAHEIRVGDLMRETDEHKRHNNYYHYRAESVWRGETFTPIHDFQGNFVGNRNDGDTVVIRWVPVSDDREPWEMKYRPNAVIEVAAEAVDDLTKLITESEEEEIL